MRRITDILIGVVATVVLAGTAAQAAKLHVPGDYATIQEAVDAASTGDKVVIGPGEHTGGVTIEGRQDLTLVGKEGHEIALEGVFVKNSSDITLKKLRIVNAFFGISVVDSSAVDIKKCVVVEASDVGISLSGSDVCVLKKNRIESVFNGGGIWVGLHDQPGTESYSNVVLRNVVMHCGGNGIEIFGDLNDIAKNELSQIAGSGIRAQSVAGELTTIRKNTIVTCGDHGIRLLGAGQYAIRNVMYGTGADGIDIHANGVTVVRNRIYDPGDDGLSVDASTGSLFKKNRIERAHGDGVRLTAASTGNTFIKNVAVDSWDWDLNKHVQEEDNAFNGNVFPVANWSPED